MFATAVLLACAVDPQPVTPPYDLPPALDAGSVEESNAAPGSWSPVRVVVGSGFACGLDAWGGVWCWTVRKDNGSVACAGGEVYEWMRAGVQARALAADGDTVCIIDGIGNLRCTDSDEGFSHVPAGTFVDLALGYGQACALSATGEIECWGSQNGQMRAEHDGPYIDVSARGFTACGLAATGRVECWGDVAKLDSTRMVGPFVAIEGMCGLGVAGLVECWAGVADPLRGLHVRAFDAGPAGVCGVTPEGALECEDGVDTQLPSSDEGFWAVAMSPARNTACATRVDGSVACWGTDTLGCRKTWPRELPPTAE